MPSLLFLNQFGDIGLLALRLIVGAIFIVNGGKKWAFWGKGALNNPEMTRGMVYIMRLLSIVEPLGGLAVLIGFLTQLVSLGLSLIVLGALFFKTQVWKIPFSSTEKLGWEFDAIILAANFNLFLMGGGTTSLDRVILGV